MGRYRIEKLKARELISDRWLPILEVEVITNKGIIGVGASPVGTRPLEDEAVYLRDGGSRYNGFGVKNAVENVLRHIAPKLIGMNFTEQRMIDELMIELDGTPNKSKLGANAILSTSLAVADAASKTLKIPAYKYLGSEASKVLPVPWIHSVEMPGKGKLGYSRSLPFQEHHIVPIGARSYSEALRMSCEVHYEAEKIMNKKYRNEVKIGGRTYYPAIVDEIEAFDTIKESIEQAGYSNEFVLAVDCAASHIYNRKSKLYKIQEKKLTREELISYYEELLDAYPIYALEDPLYKDDFEGHAVITKELKIQIVGDDLFVTNLNRLKKGIKVNAANALLLKPNQIGSLTEALDTALFAQKNGYRIVVSGRQGIDEEDLIPDIAVALNAGQIKIGPLPTRRSKYNRLLKIEEELGNSASYMGRKILNNNI